MPHTKSDFSLDHARKLDETDPLPSFRNDFVVPTISDLKSTHIETNGPQFPHAALTADQSEPRQCTYLCGNSLGLQPKCVSRYVSDQLCLWATKGVYGHFKPVKGTPVPAWLDMDEQVTLEASKIAGCDQSEVAIMQTLTANLHLLMASFYRPTKDRYKIIIESKAFPSDFYLVESQLRHYGYTTDEALITIEPEDDETRVNGAFHSKNSLLTTSRILSVIDTHASSTALLLLPGIQFYTGQLFDTPTITKHAQAKGITVGWDLAHAMGNVPLHLHDWNVDFAAWCNYKYLNCGPGAIGGLFVHSRHTASPTPTHNGTNGTTTAPAYRHRLAGWWGSSKAARFAMTNEFIPIPGAGGFQLSNPSAIDMAAVLASYSVFSKTDMSALREKSLRLTAYLENLLDQRQQDFWTRDEGRVTTEHDHPERAPWQVITPRDPAQRGAQLSIRLQEGLLEHVMQFFEEKGVVVDERKPDVVRVAPAPLYNTFEDVARFGEVFVDALHFALHASSTGSDVRSAEDDGRGEAVVNGTESMQRT